LRIKNEKKNATFNLFLSGISEVALRFLLVIGF
jgi:hypothetical protein